MYNCKVSSSICSSPIGPLTVSYCPEGLHGINQISTINDQSFSPNQNELVEILSSNGKIPIPDDCLNWLTAYFNRSLIELEHFPVICSRVLTKTHSFQENVWYTLLHEISFGQTITYGELAALAGNKSAARAVGSAMRRNPFQILIPCHRVIRSTGEQGKYGGGERNRVKSWLLAYEKDDSSINN